MKDAHKAVLISEDDYDHFSMLFCKTLYELKISKDIVDFIIELMAKIKYDISMKNCSIYDRLGGPKKFEAITELFYKKVMYHNKLGVYFKNVNMGMQKKKFK